MEQFCRSAMSVRCVTASAFGLLLLHIGACSLQEDKVAEPTAPHVTGPGGTEAIAVALTVPTPADLPACGASLVQQVVYIESPPSLRWCRLRRGSYSWVELPCSTANVGDVAYADVNPLLLSCTKGRWTPIALSGQE